MSTKPVGGPLKIKGGLPSPGGIKKKSKKKSSHAASTSLSIARVESLEEQAQSSDPDEKLKAITRGQKLQQPSEQEDRRTTAEKRFEQAQIDLEKKRLGKMATKSHRDRVKDFNDYLSKLSEHHDIPRVGPG